ncbi:MAG: ABC transporter substrate-binding protein [Defluviitaleaceae bacterium]|nr:ABC transporter substrate-binding protein [Defluviitaleaceae bacterium]
MMMRTIKKAVALALVAVLGVALLTGCNTNGGDGVHAQGITDDEIRIGMVFPVSGWAAFFGVPIHDGIEAVLNRANAHGGIGGRQINFIFYDDQGLPEVGHVLIETLLEEDRVFALMGISGGQAAMSLDYMLDFGVPILNITGGAGFLYSEYDPGSMLFNIQPSNNIDSPLLLARALATPVFGPNRDQYLPEDGIIGFLTAPTEAGFELAAVLESVATEIGVRDRIIVDFATADIYPTMVHQMMTAGVSTLIYAGMGGMAISAAMYDAGWYVPLFATYGLSTITSWSVETYSPQRPIFANIWAEDTSPQALEMLRDMRDSLNYLPRISSAEADGYIDNGFARAGYLTGMVMVEALQRFVDLGLDFTWENFVTAMEHAPFSLGGTPTFSYANGRRMGVESLALWEFWVNAQGEAEVAIVSEFSDLEEILAPWRARTGR